MTRQSEPHHQHQNPVERKIQDIKRTMNGIMDRTGCPSKWWLLAALFTIGLMNYLPNSSGDIPLTCISGHICDMSKHMHFHYWQEVFVSMPDGKEEKACWCFPADNVGDELTYWVPLDKSEQLVPRSNVRAARDPLFPNLRLRPQTDDLCVPASSPAPTSAPTLHPLSLLRPLLRHRALLALLPPLRHLLLR